MTAPTSIQRIARSTGLAYLGIILAGIFAEFVVRSRLVHLDDAAATAADIAASAGLFRAGMAADLAMIAFDVAVAVGLYVLLREVSRPLALLAAAFRLLQAAILGANLFNMADALLFSVGSASDGAVGAAQLQALALASMETHALAYDIGLVFFGIACIVLGRLLWTSRLLPRALGLALGLAGGVYLVGSFAAVLAPEAAVALESAYLVPFVAELAVAGWLVVRGVRAPVGVATGRVAATA